MFVQILDFIFIFFFLELVQHIKAIILLKKGGKRNSQEENEKKLRFYKKIIALWTRASESGYLVQIFDSVSVMWSLFNIFKS
jgi:hypothetical protein